MDQAAALVPSRASNTVRSLAPFALAGIALVGVVLDEIDVPHDTVQGVSILGAGAAAGVLADLVVARWTTTDEQAARARLAAWDVVRLFLAFEMVRYGMAKVVGMQFYPQYWRLDTRAVDMKPSWLAWTFFGRAYGYQAIGGIIEVASGVLVAFRRTTLLGACVMATALVNVVLVNFFYDVPVKLFASVYLTMDLCLIAREAPRLRAFFLQPSHEGLPGSRTRVLRAVLIALALGLPTAEILHEASRYGVFRVETLEGAWRVDRRIGLDDLLPEMPGPWDKVYFEKGGFGFIRVGEKRARFGLEVDDEAHTLRLEGFGGPASPTLEGTFEVRDYELHFAGNRAGKPFSIDLTREFPR